MKTKLQLHTTSRFVLRRNAGVLHLLSVAIGVMSTIGERFCGYAEPDRNLPDKIVRRLVRVKEELVKIHMEIGGGNG